MARLKASVFELAYQDGGLYTGGTPEYGSSVPQQCLVQDFEYEQGSRVEEEAAICEDIPAPSYVGSTGRVRFSSFVDSTLGANWLGLHQHIVKLTWSENGTITDTVKEGIVETETYTVAATQTQKQRVEIRIIDPTS